MIITEIERCCVPAGDAMGNGIDEVKQAAGFTTLSNDEDGVAIFLEKHVLGG